MVKIRVFVAALMLITLAGHVSAEKRLKEKNQQSAGNNAKYEKSPSLNAIDPWIPLPPGNARTHAAYFELHNIGAEEQTIISVASPQYKDAQIHLTTVKDNIASMQHLAEVKVPAGGNLSFKPLGYHIMLIRPKAKIIEGDKIAITLGLADGRLFSLNAEVKRRGGKQVQPGHKH